MQPSSTVQDGLHQPSHSRHPLLGICAAGDKLLGQGIEHGHILKSFTTASATLLRTILDNGADGVAKQHTANNEYTANMICIHLRSSFDLPR